MQYQTARPSSPWTQAVSSASLLYRQPKPMNDRNLSHGHTQPCVDLRSRIEQLGDLPGWPVERQLELLDTVAGSELGAFVMAHGGLDAHWTDVVVTHQSGSARNHADILLLERLPATLATRHRYGIFRQLLQAALRPRMTLLSIPCGTLTDLLSLDYRNAPEVHLIGVDIDAQALATARSRALQQGLPVDLRQQDAWQGDIAAEADIVVSHGLSSTNLTPSA